MKQWLKLNRMSALRMKLFIAGLAVNILTIPIYVQAQTQMNFPSKPISLVVPYAPGGPTDAMARTLANAIKPPLGQVMVVENKAGAGANIGAEYVARSEADGYTLMFLW